MIFRVTRPLAISLLLTVPVVGQGADARVMAGVVRDAASHSPIAGAVVVVTAPGRSRRTVTTTSGAFRIDGVDPGVYRVTASKPGYLDGGYGQPWPDGPLTVVTVSAGKDTTVVLDLWRPGVISGTVEDEAGQPVSGLEVTALRRQWINGALQFADRAIAKTDDRGAYRIPGLIPGDHIVAVSSTRTSLPAELVAGDLGAGGSLGTPVGDVWLRQSNGLGVHDDATRGVLVVPSTFFPGTTSLAAATPLTVGSGDEIGGVNLQLREVEARRVSGRVTSADSSDAALTQLSLVPKALDGLSSEIGFETAITTANAQGAFTFLAVPAGDYVIRVLKTPSPRRLTSAMERETAILLSRMGTSAPDGTRLAGPPPAQPTLWAATSVAVTDRNVDDVVVALREAPRISGECVFDGARPGPVRGQDGVLRALSVVQVPADGAIPGVLSLADRVQDDFTFTTYGVPPGRYFLRVIGAVPGWQVRSILVDGRDVADGAIDLGPGGLTGVVVRFTDEPPAGVGGVVRRADGAPAVGAVVLVFPADRSQWAAAGTGSRRIRLSSTDADGHYVIADLPAGDYLATAVPAPDARDWQRPGFLDSASAFASAVHLDSGRQAAQDLKLGAPHRP